MKIKLSNANDVVQIEKSNGTVIDIGQIHANVAENTSAVGGLQTAVGNMQEDVGNLQAADEDLKATDKILSEEVDGLKEGFSPLTNAHIAKTAKWEDALMEGDDLQWVGARSIEPQNSDQPLASDMVWNEDFQWV